MWDLVNAIQAFLLDNKPKVIILTILSNFTINQMQVGLPLMHGQ